MNLFFHQAAIGDFVLTFGFLRALAERGGRTVVVSSFSKAALAARVVAGTTPMDIELWEFTRLHAAGGPTHLSPAVAELFEQAEWIVSFISTGADPWAQNVARLAPQAEPVYVAPRAPADWTSHVCTWYRAQLERAELFLPEAPAPKGGQLDGPLVVHPGSGGLAKCWPIERFEALIDQLTSRGRRVQPVFGEVEMQTWPTETLDRWQDRYSAQPLQSLNELYDVLVAASAYAGNDSGPTHLAAQLGLPTIALFGPTDPTRWAPQGPRVKLIAPAQPCPMDWLLPDQVVKVVMTLR